MRRRSSLADVVLDVEEQDQPLPRPQPDTPFRILLLGDFSGRAHRGMFDPAWNQRRPLMVDRDNVDQVLERLAPEIEVPIGEEGGRSVTFAFRELEDFEPDRLMDLVAPFCEPRPLTALPASAAAAAAPAQSAPPPASGADLLREMLGEPAAPPPPKRHMDDFDRLLNQIVAPYAEPKPDPRQAARAADKDAAIGEALRRVMHHPAFQSLEAAWRGVYFLVQRLETSSELQIYLMDVSKAELAASVVFCDNLEDSAAYRELVEKTARTPGAHRWSVMAGLYTFDAGPQDQATLTRMAEVARLAGAPFLAQASPRLAGCESLAGMPDPRTWQAPNVSAVRRRADARWLGLAAPRFLLRLPYGAGGTTAERMPFEELQDGPAHELYLWGNPALICVTLLAEAFLDSGWQFRPGERLEIEGLPAHVYHENGEAHLKECAEALLSERALEALMDCGIMPLATIKNTDRARLIRFQSFADPVSPLAGPWQ